MDPRLIRPFAFLGGYWLAFFHYSAYAGILYLVLRITGLIAGNGAAWQHAYTLYAKGAFVVVMAILVYGGWNALHPVVRNVEHDSGKNLPRPVKIVLVTDLHLGAVFGRQYAEELTERINRQNADLVLVGGDLADNSLNYLLREKSYEPLKNIRSRYGVYAVLGNHDHFDGRIQTELDLFTSVGFHMLVDEAVDLPCNIHLVGLEDYRNSPGKSVLEKLAGTDPGKANLLLEHQPRRFLEAEKAGYDLYMAGHTHGGQQAPLNLVTK
ncbi:MAG: metallophosphoesterase, partial [Acidaminococcaceae bacterium]|nr:metallophosphoesterase [Acidaminococcaceae bacterium]